MLSVVSYHVGICHQAQSASLVSLLLLGGIPKKLACSLYAQPPVRARAFLQPASHSHGRVNMRFGSSV